MSVPVHVPVLCDHGLVPWRAPTGWTGVLGAHSLCTTSCSRLPCRQRRRSHHWHHPAGLADTRSWQHSWGSCPCPAGTEKSALPGVLDAQGPAWGAFTGTVPVLGAPWAHGCCPQVELLALVDLQGAVSVSVDNVTFEQCYLDVVSPTAAGTARAVWAGRVTSDPFRGGCLGAVTLSKNRTMVQKAKGQGQARILPWPGTPAWGKLGEWGRGAGGKGHLGDPFAFVVPYPLSPPHCHLSLARAVLQL